MPRVFPLRLVVDLAKQPVMRLVQLCAKAHNFLISEMIVPGSTYWNIGIGREPGDVEKDAEGIQTMKDLGRNLAWLLKKMGAPAAAVTPAPVNVNRTPAA